MSVHCHCKCDVAALSAVDDCFIHQACGYSGGVKNCSQYAYTEIDIQVKQLTGTIELSK